MKTRKKHPTEADFAKAMDKALAPRKLRPQPRINNPRIWLQSIDDDCPPFYDIKRSAHSTESK